MSGLWCVWCDMYDVCCDGRCGVVCMVYVACGVVLGVVSYVCVCGVCGVVIWCTWWV